MWILAILPLLCATQLTSEAQCLTSEVEVIVEIENDVFAPSETSWTIHDSNANLIASGAPDGTTLCVDASLCLTFTIRDTGGDGLSSNFLSSFPGSFTVYYDGNLISTGVDFGFEATADMGTCLPGSSCSSPIQVTENNTYTAAPPNTWYEFTVSQSGMYEVSTCDQGNSCDTRIYMYDYCQNLLWQDNQQGTMAYADDVCGLLAKSSVALAAGDVIYIRIADDLGDCGIIPIDWTLKYQGAISGCMDASSCTFNPMATVSDPSSCLYPPDCPDGPDLAVDEQQLIATIFYETRSNSDGCFVAEGCMNGYGTREILRFTTKIDNIGNQDFYIGQTPASTTATDPLWEWDNCHSHWHYEGYAEYVLYDAAGNLIPIGFKNGFCVMDLSCDGGGVAKYHCTNQGISAGCEDFYDYGLDCQWIDITDVADGQYTLVVRVNWNQKADALGRQELTFSNNWGQVCIDIDRTNPGVLTVINTCSPYVDCAGDIYGSAELDCNGVCNGLAHPGDLDGDYLYTQDDIDSYINEILYPYIAASACTDLDSDGQIDLNDAAQVAACKVVNESNNNTTDHDHCNLPTTEVYNPNQLATFSIGDHDPVNQYVDIYLTNPGAPLFAYQLQISGLEIQSISSILNEPGYDMTYGFNADGELVAVSPSETPTGMYATPEPLIRIYYTSLTASDVCITAAPAAINALREEIETDFGDCLSVNGVQFHLKVLLEGPYLSTSASMSSAYLYYGLLPVNQPFSQAPWNYSGLEQVPDPLTLPSAIVDWVLVEIWDDNGLVDRVAAVVLQDGTVTDVDGVANGVDFNFVTQGSYYVVVRSRNHLDQRSNNMVTVNNAANIFDFSQGDVAGGMTSLTELSPGVYGMAAGDFDANGVINFVDFNQYLSNSSGLLSYDNEDCNLDSHVTVIDYNLYRKNSSKIASPELRF